MEPYAPYEIITFPSSEHYFQAMKSTDVNYRRKIAATVKPGDAKRAGRNIKVRSDWEDIKISVMKLALWFKFSSPILRNLLVMTAPHDLVEGNKHGDKFWGVFNGVGVNMLGQLLMELRDIFIKNPTAGLKIYTAHMNWNGAFKLDITAKKEDPIGTVFAPTWELVKAYLVKRISKEIYTERYRAIMEQSYVTYRHVWDYILTLPEVTFCCYCKPTDFCHRKVLPDYFIDLGTNPGASITQIPQYIEERKL